MATYNKTSHEVVFAAVARAAVASTYLARTIEIAGNVAGFSLWQRAAERRMGRGTRAQG